MQSRPLIRCRLIIPLWENGAHRAFALDIVFVPPIVRVLPIVVVFSEVVGLHGGDRKISEVA